MLNDAIGFPSQVSIDYLKLISIEGYVVDLNDYLVEINIFEDIFNNFLSGQIMLSDSRNLIAKMPIIGNEYLLVKFETPTMGITIDKIFRVYSVDNISAARDNNTRTYVLNFTSIEAISDSAIAIFRPFSGLISDIAGEIYTTFLQTPSVPKFEDNDIKFIEDSFRPFLVLPTKNKVKFISPGWSPAKCLNWLASKAISEDDGAPDYLFWETTTNGFLFTSIEDIAKTFNETGLIKGTYYHSPTGNFDTEEIVDKMFIAERFEVVNFVDNLKNSMSGYFGSTLGTYDVYKKTYIPYAYNHIEGYSSMSHFGDGIAPFNANTPINPIQNLKFYPVNPKLFSGIKENHTEVTPRIHGRRLARMNELNNFRVNITVPGRTDMYAGAVVNFIYPDTGVMNEASQDPRDPLLSGIYLVTAIRHKINFRSHTMIMEMVKDSLQIVRS